MDLEGHRRDWEDLAAVDPLWAILSDPSRRDGGWDADAFLATGEAKIETLMANAGALGLPLAHRVALDFGCGAGRLTRPLARHFARCIGIDVSEGMIEQARDLHAGVEGLEFVHNAHEALPGVPDRSVDLVLSVIVLQHVSPPSAIAAYLGEFARVLADGGLLVVQLPSRIPWRHRVQPRPRLYRLLRGLGIPAQTLHTRLRLTPIRMRALEVGRVHALLEAGGLRVVETDTRHVSSIDSTTYTATRDPVAAAAA